MLILPQFYAKSTNLYAFFDGYLTSLIKLKLYHLLSQFRKVVECGIHMARSLEVLYIKFFAEMKPIIFFSFGWTSLMAISVLVYGPVGLLPFISTDHHCVS